MNSLLVLLFLFLSSVANAQLWQAESGAKQVALLELFTAEGCGLCPEADRWVHQLPQQGYSENKLIVLGFHIDYLNDKKGWIDRFAKPEFSERQRQLARLNLYQTVYTPEFVVSGEVIHNWKKYVKNVVDAVNKFTPEAHIALSVSAKDGSLYIKTRVDVTGEQNRQHSKLYLAISENDVESKVLAGDNAGATFMHQNLVRKWLGPFDIDNSGPIEHRLTLDIDKHWNTDAISLIAVVQNLDDGFVLQSLKLPLE